MKYVSDGLKKLDRKLQRGLENGSLTMGVSELVEVAPVVTEAMRMLDAPAPDSSPPAPEGLQLFDVLTDGGDEQMHVVAHSMDDALSSFLAVYRHVPYHLEITVVDGDDVFRGGFSSLDDIDGLAFTVLEDDNGNDYESPLSEEEIEEIGDSEIVVQADVKEWVRFLGRGRVNVENFEPY